MSECEISMHHDCCYLYFSFFFLICFVDLLLYNFTSLSSIYVVWIRLNGWQPVSYVQILGKADGILRDPTGYEIIADNGGVLFQILDDFAGAAIYFPGRPFDNQWHHYALVIDFENIMMTAYIDGETSPLENLKGTNLSKNGYINSLRPLIIGGEFARAGASESDQAMNGALEEMAVWKRALTQAEIKELYRDQSESPLCGQKTSPTLEVLDAILQATLQTPSVPTGVVAQRNATDPTTLAIQWTVPESGTYPIMEYTFYVYLYNSVYRSDNLLSTYSRYLGDNVTDLDQNLSNESCDMYLGRVQASGLGKFRGQRMK